MGIKGQTKKQQVYMIDYKHSLYDLWSMCQTFCNCNDIFYVRSRMKFKFFREECSSFTIYLWIQIVCIGIKLVIGWLQNSNIKWSDKITL